jgi:hypothetical protein
MKKIAILILVYNITNAQEVAIEMSKMNIAYAGLNNSIVVMVAGLGCNEFIVWTDNGIVHQEKNCNYTFSPEKVGIANIYFKRSIKAMDTIACRKIRIKPLPTPSAKFANKSGGNIGLGEFKAQYGLIALLEGFDIDARFNIESYKINVIRGNNVLHSVLNHGGRIEISNQYIIDQVKIGDKIIFENIFVKMPGLEKSQKLNSLIFEIE